MINHVIRIVTGTVTTTVSVTEMIVAVRKIRHATVTKAVTDRVTLKHQKKKIRVKTKEAMTMRQKMQSNTDSEVSTVILQNKIIFLPCNLYAQF